MKITDETPIRVYFNDLSMPTSLTYAAEIDGKPVYLRDAPADANDLADIQELSESGPHECRSEHFYLHYYIVKNGDLSIPFTQEDFPDLNIK